MSPASSKRDSSQSEQQSTADRELVLEALDRILASDSFKGANRLQDFLRYVVMETLDGREEEIRAKRIAYDVYQRTPDADSDQEIIVRVDAGRLRRRLIQYYADEGREDPLQISLSTGTYVPEFIPATAPNEAAEVKTMIVGWPLRLTMAVLGVLVISAAGAIWVIQSEQVLQATRPSSPYDSQALERERSAVFEASPATLQTQLLLNEAYGLLYPPLDRARLEAAKSLCEKVLVRQPQSAEAHACSGFALAFLAFFEPRGEARDALVEAAFSASGKAVGIDAANAYAQSALAWTMFVGRQFEDAIPIGRLSVSLEAGNQFVRNIFGMMLGFDGQTQRLLSGEDLPGFDGGIEDEYHPFLLAVSYFHAGNYAKTIDFIQRAAAQDAHVSALMTALLIASYELSGEDRPAEKYARELRTFWPGWDPDERLHRYFRHPSDAEVILEQVQTATARAGLPEP